MSGVAYKASARSEGAVTSVQTMFGQSVLLLAGQWYRVTHRSETQRLSRESVMQYLWLDAGGTLAFSARPVAGTQQLPLHWLVDAVEVPPGTKVVLSRVVR